MGRAISPPPSSPLPAAEELRLLAERSELGYVERPDLALADEPEAVDERYQNEITARARRQAGARALALWRESSARWLADLDALVALRFDVDVADELRSLMRAVERVDRKLGGRPVALA